MVRVIKVKVLTVVVPVAVQFEPLKNEPLNSLAAYWALSALESCKWVRKKGDFYGFTSTLLGFDGNSFSMIISKMEVLTAV